MDHDHSSNIYSCFSLNYVSGVICFTGFRRWECGRRGIVRSPYSRLLRDQLEARPYRATLRYRVEFVAVILRNVL